MKDIRRLYSFFCNESFTSTRCEQIIGVQKSHILASGSKDSRFSGDECAPVGFVHKYMNTWVFACHIARYIGRMVSTGIINDDDFYIGVSLVF